jgi:very-short-patch-repair endonuclease
MHLQLILNRARQKFPKKNTAPEMLLFQELEKSGIKFEKHKTIFYSEKNMTQPDAFIEPNVCIYVDGDYWHSREEVKKRDQIINTALPSLGLVVIRFSESHLKRDVLGCLDKIQKLLSSSSH